MVEDQELSPSELARRLAQRPRKPRQALEHKCEVCGAVFESPRTTRRYCSQRCNQRAYHQRQRTGEARRERSEAPAGAP